MSGDPYRYFRIEARELVDGLTQGILELEKGRSGNELLSRLLRYAHTLKGAARIVKQMQISELSHRIEEILTGLRKPMAVISPDQIRQLLAWMDQITTALAGIAQPAPRATNPAADGSLPSMLSTDASVKKIGEPLETVRLDMREMDILLRTISELRVQMAGLSRLTPELQQAARLAENLRDAAPVHLSSSIRMPAADMPATRDHLASALRELHRTISTVWERSERQLVSLYEQAEALRLVPANSIFSVLERTARDAAEATGKHVVFEATGGDTRLDARGLRLLRNALLHLVRNAVTHGLESPPERAQAGKTPTGSVKITVERRGDHALFTCYDDGRGVNVERVRQVMVERKWVTTAEALELNASTAITLLLRGGITTSPTVSELSGRGIGLDVVREAVATLNGTVTGTTEPGKGTHIRIAVPVWVESLDVLQVQAEDQYASVPLQAVKQALRLTVAEIIHSPQGQSILWNGQVVRYAPLTDFIPGSLDRGPRTMSVLVLESPTGLGALGVDHIVAQERIVIRALPQILGPIPLLRGAFLDSAGNPQLVFNPEELVPMIRSRSSQERAGSQPPRPRLLIIDDSLTTRMLEQGILEAAGYEVDTAASGEEALEKAQESHYHLFIVDVEMPGMDGYQFIQTTHARDKLRHVPSVVVTSRSAPEDRARGAAVGARGYIVKSEFDESLFLETIRELVG